MIFHEDLACPRFFRLSFLGLTAFETLLTMMDSRLDEPVGTDAKSRRLSETSMTLSRQRGFSKAFEVSRKSFKIIQNHSKYPSNMIESTRFLVPRGCETPWPVQGTVNSRAQRSPVSTWRYRMLRAIKKYKEGP